MTHIIRARAQAKAQVDAIIELMGAYNLDWDRLEQLRDADLDDLGDEDRAELGELTTAAAGFEDQEAAQQACYYNALSVELRSGWYTPGSESTEPEEARILLCTGGPHVELQYQLAPARVRVLYQDWGTGPTEYFPDSGDRATLLQYCELVAGGLV